MARASSLLNIRVRTDAVPTLEISDDQFAELEAIYREALNETARAELMHICDRFLFERDWEVNGEKLADAKRLLERVEKATAGFKELGFGSLIDNSAAGAAVNWALLEGLDRTPVVLHERDVEISGQEDDGTLRWDDVDLGGRALKLNMSGDLLMRMALSLDAALRHAGKALDQRSELRTNAFDDWLRGMRAWAVRNGLKKSYNGPFVPFLFQLNKLFPETHQKAVNSEDAMMERLKRATSKGKKGG